jgi:hypothetical protein
MDQPEGVIVMLNEWVMVESYIMLKLTHVEFSIQLKE